MNASTPRPDNLFQPGNAFAANRRGQKGARQKLAAVVFADAMEHWDANGPGALRRLAFHDPAAYVQFIAKLLPQRVEHETVTPFDGVDETLLAVSLQLARAIAFLPAEDRELLDMLLTKGEMLASQKKLSADAAEEGVGGQSSQEFFGGKGTPHPQSVSTADRQIAGPNFAADPVGESATDAAVLRNADVIEGDFEEEA